MGSYGFQEELIHFQGQTVYGTPMAIHSLVNWGLMHGGIDGFSRFIVFLKCSTRKNSETVKQCFLVATEHFEWPSRVRTDHGGENVKVSGLMEEGRGTNRGNWVPTEGAGTSVRHNRELTQRRRQRQRKRHLKINIWEMLTIFRLFLLPRILYC